MQLTTIRALFLAVPNLEAAASTYERLGLHVREQEGSRVIAIGAPANLVELHLVLDPPRSGLFAIGVESSDVEAVLAVCERHQIAFTRSEEGVRLCLHATGGADVILKPSSPRLPVQHSFPLLRLDHLASITPDLEGPTHVWKNVLGVAVVGEVHVADPLMIVRQLALGDAIFELLGDPTASGPLRQRPFGLLSMASWEVANLEDAVAQARAAGFTVSDPVVGALPGTRIATIAAEELAGLRMQLLQYTLDEAA